LVVAVSAAGGTISVLVGAVLMRLTMTGTYRRYVRPGMGPWLAVAAVAVVVIGLATLIRAIRSTQPTESPGDYGSDGRLGAGWLLLAPISALLLVAPPTLGSFGVDRGATVDIRAGAAVFDPIPTDAPPRPMTLLEFGQRAFDRDGASLDGASVRLTGFVAGAETGGGFPLARYQIACCAADATPVVIRIIGVAGDPPARDQWLVVTGTFAGLADDVPELAATTVEEIPPPEDPYE
jgi:uncharacterized repeat protein (TIGR03943 family)